MSDPKHFANVGYPRRGEVAGRSKIDSLCEASVANQADVPPSLWSGVSASFPVV